jgi:hypothetical protein
VKKTLEVKGLSHEFWILANGFWLIFLIIALNSLI